MKKSILTEIRTMKKMMGLISEQEEEQMSYEDCLSGSMNFYFGKTIKPGTNNEDGGMLYHWSSKGNDYPDLGDKKSLEKFLEIVKNDYAQEEMVWDMECEIDGFEKPSWEEVLPTIMRLYYETLMKKTRPGNEQYTEEDVPELIARYSQEMPPDDFEDVFDRAEQIIWAVVSRINAVGPKMTDNEFNRLFNKIKDEYGPQLTGVENPYEGL